MLSIHVHNGRGLEKAQRRLKIYLNFISLVSLMGRNCALCCDGLDPWSRLAWWVIIYTHGGGRYKTLLPWFFFFPSLYLSTLLVSFCQLPPSSPCPLLPNHRSMLLKHSLFVSLFFAIFSLCSRYSPRRYCFICCRRCRRRSPWRISSSKLAKRVLISKEGC